MNNWTYKILVLIAIIVLFGCTGVDKPNKPKDLIPEDKMVNILVDISILNASKGSNKVILEKNNVHPDEYIFGRYEIDSLQFASSSNYYAYDTDKYQEIYKRVRDSLTVMQKLYEEKKKEEEALKQNKRDSLNKTIKNKLVNDTVIPINKPKIALPKDSLPELKKELLDSLEI